MSDLGLRFVHPHDDHCLKKGRIDLGLDFAWVPFHKYRDLYARMQFLEVLVEGVRMCPECGGTKTEDLPHECNLELKTHYMNEVAIKNQVKIMVNFEATDED